MAQEVDKPIFKDSTFAIIISRDLPRIQAEDLESNLIKHGGKCEPLGAPLDLCKVTHIISATIDFPEYHKARLQMISIVVPNWVMVSLVKNKDAQVRPFTPDPNLFFSNVTISCGDIPQGDQDAIIGAVLAMGGMESSTLTKLTTHICALTMDHPKCVAAREKNLKCKIVLPHWFDDCLKLGKRISETPYLLPDPEILRAKSTDGIPATTSEDIQGAINPHPERLPVPTDTPMRRLSVFKDKAVMLCKDLEINPHLRKVLEDLVEGGGGAIAETVHDANMFVGRWREGRDYVFASRAQIDVGNLSWLYYMVTYNEWTSPLRRLLHYPLPRGGLPGFKGLKITLSNYAGETRIYLENIITSSGAEFTKSMKQDNTHLVTARDTSEKCNAAREWSIEMINHLWLEESYARCEAQRISDPRYTHFPPRTNLSEIIGKTSFDPQHLEEIYFPKDPTPSPEDPKLSRKPMHEKDRNAHGSKKSKGDIVMGDVEEAAEAKVTPRPSRPKPRSSLAQASTPSSNRRVSAGKENDTPLSTGSRSAKSKAASRISGLAPDIALYEKEKKRKGSVWGGERAANRIDRDGSGERSMSPATAKANKAQDVDSSDEEVKITKRQKTSHPEVTMRLLVTGYKGWVEAPNKEDSDKKKLRDLGILVIQEPLHCSHLAAPCMVRTKKFLCALASGPTVLSTDFIDACVKKKEIQEPEDFLLRDTAAEKKFKLKLKDVVTRAKANKRRLLQGVLLYCTESIKNGWDTYRDIVTANGGQLHLFKSKPMIKQIRPEDDDGPAEPIYLITGDTADERKHWAKFAEYSKAGNMIPKIVSTDWILDVAMSQQMKSSASYLMKDQ